MWAAPACTTTPRALAVAAIRSSCCTDSRDRRTRGAPSRRCCPKDAARSSSTSWDAAAATARSAGAPVKGPRGLVVSIAECEPHNGPGLHRHLNTVENFFCLSGRFEISWGDNGEYKTVLEPNDMVSVPRGENRMFFNISDQVGRLLVMIVPETDEQVDPISYAPSLAKEIETEYGKSALEGLQKIGFKFGDA